MTRGAARAALLASLLASPAASQPSDAVQKAQAEALFQEGRALAAAGDCVNAVRKLEASDELESTAGTLLNLAVCYEKLGRTASAWVTYRRAASVARARGQAARETAARARADALEPDLSYLKILVNEPPADLEVELDGRRVQPVMFGSAFPVDAGRRTLVASRPGHVQWRNTIEVPDRRGAIEVTIPTLEAIATHAATAPALAPPTAPPARRPVVRSEIAPRAAGSPPRSSQRTWALVVGGVGLVGLGSAAVFSVLAIDKNDQSKDHCDPNDASRCSATGDALRDDARAYADVATVSTVLGVVGLGTGIVLGVTAPSSQPTWSAGVGDRRVWLRSTF